MLRINDLDLPVTLQFLRNPTDRLDGGIQQAGDIGPWKDLAQHDASPV
jgi:hypothetical protein